MLQPEDILLILGKGHEDYQIIGHTKIHLDDAEEVENWKNVIKNTAKLQYFYCYQPVIS